MGNLYSTNPLLSSDRFQSESVILLMAERAKGEKGWGEGRTDVKVGKGEDLDLDQDKDNHVYKGNEKDNDTDKDKELVHFGRKYE